jgi:hypothetical protein
LIYPVCAITADYEFDTSIAAIYEYNDNIFLSANDVFSDNIYTIAPKLEWARHAERLDVRADGMVEWYRYQDNDELDDTDQWYNAYVNYQPTERWQLAIEGHASDDNRPDRDIETTGLVLGNIRRKRSNVNTTASYLFSEITSAGVYAEFNRENFDDPETSDRKDYSLVLFVNRSLEAWLARTTGRLNLVYSHYAFEREFTQQGNLGFFDVTTALQDDLVVDNVSLTAGTESVLTERLDMLWDIGARYSHSERDLMQTRTYTPPLISEAPLQSEITYDSYGFVGSFNLKYRAGETSRGELLISHDLQPVSGESGTANRTTVRLSGRKRFLEKLSGNAFLQWYWNISDEDDPTQDDIDQQTWNAGAGLRWELNDYFDLAANYVYTHRDDRETDQTANRSKVLLQLVAHHDWME